MDEKIVRIKEWLDRADAVMIGAGAGLSSAAGFLYSGERFDRYFGDFGRKFGFRDMYSGGFYPYRTREEFWAYWSRYIWINRYADAPGSVYDDLLRLVRDRDHFILTTNVDHCFQKAGFDKKRLFYTQGDYGLFQCTKPCCRKTWDNRETVRDMVLSQGFVIGPGGELSMPEGRTAATAVPSELLPVCPICGRPLTMNLRSDDKFVEDEGWRKAAAAYEAWLTGHRSGKTVFLEIGVGFNTPGIIKYNFWQETYRNPDAVYVCLNMDESPVPEEIRDRSAAVGGDCARIIRELVP